MLEQGGVYCKRCGRRTKHKSAKKQRSKPVKVDDNSNETSQQHSTKHRVRDAVDAAVHVVPKPPISDRSKSNPRPKISREEDSSSGALEQPPKRTHRVSSKPSNVEQGHNIVDTHSTNEPKSAKRPNNAALKATDDIVSRKEAISDKQKIPVSEPAIQRKPTLLDDIPRATEGGGYLDMYQKKRQPYISDTQSVRVASSPIYNPYDESNSLPAIHEKKQRKHPRGRLHSTKSAPARYQDGTVSEGLQLPPPVRKSHDYDDFQKPVALLQQQKNRKGQSNYSRKKSL